MKVEGNCFLQFGYLLDACIGPQCTIMLKLITVLVALSNKEYSILLEDAMLIHQGFLLQHLIHKYTRGIARGAWGACDPLFCKPFFSKQPTTGGEYDITIRLW